MTIRLPSEFAGLFVALGVLFKPNTTLSRFSGSGVAVAAAAAGGVAL